MRGASFESVAAPVPHNDVFLTKLKLPCQTDSNPAWGSAHEWRGVWMRPNYILRQLRPVYTSFKESASRFWFSYRRSSVANAWQWESAKTLIRHNVIT